jgi:hypothetical protein
MIGLIFPTEQRSCRGIISCYLNLLKNLDIFVFMNVYEMYILNECKFGFYIVRDSWGFTVAKVIKIEGVTEGKVIPGKAPYFGNPKVFAEFYKTPNIRELEGIAISDICNSSNLTNEGEVSCPGTGGYSMLN